jgi:hypothetical protein
VACGESRWPPFLFLPSKMARGQFSASSFILKGSQLSAVCAASNDFDLDNQELAASKLPL